jgi:ATPase subunit of ABC transporter with duplicated ATPase domains
MIDISLQQVQKKYYQKSILESVSFDVLTGAKIGLIGRNGAGKTTLFRLMTREELPDAGQVTLRRGLRVGLLEQLPQHQPGHTVDQVLREGFSELMAQKATLTQLENDMTKTPDDPALLKRYGEILTAFESSGGYDMDVKLREIALALKLENHLDQTFGRLSGGEKTRVLFGRLLLQAPDVLLLDEPTNHLDSDMLEWLERYFNVYDGTVIIISHDRYFLDQVAQSILELEHGVVQQYEGNYSWYAIEKEKQKELARQQYQLQQKKIKAIEAAIQRFELWGSMGDNEKFFKKANQFKSRLDKLDRIKPPDHGQLSYQLNLEGTRKSSKKLIEATQLTLGYGQNRLIQNASLTLSKGERLCLLGANGTGKTTLLRAILGQFEPMSGEIKISPTASIGYIPQDIEFDDPNLSLHDWCIQTLGTSSGEARNLLAHYGFKDQEVFRSLGTLSGGERSRLKLIQLSKSRHTLLLLDEPTNHMDIPSREQLEDLLTSFAGTLLFISHDRYFIEMIASEILWLHDQQLERLEGNYSDYLALRAQRLEQSKFKTAKSKPENDLRKERPKTYQKEKLRLQTVEQEIEAIEHVLKQMESDLTAAAHDFQRLEVLSRETEVIRQRHHNLMEEWATLTELIEVL